MFVLLLQFAGLAAVIVVAGMFLTRSADAIGEHTKLGRTLAGMVLLALATSLPELTIGTQAARNNAPDLAVGDLLGATLFNLLTLSVIDLMTRSRQILSRMAAAHAISAVAGITLIGIVGGAIFLQFHLQNKLVWLGQDPGTWAVIVSYLLLLRLIYFDQQYMLKHLPAEEAAPEELYAGYPMRRAVPVFLAAGAAIFFAAPWMAHVSEEIARQSGLGQSFVGTTMLAFATTLPEFITTVTAVRMGAYDLAVGNVLGSTAFNMALLFAVDLFYPGPLLAHVGEQNVLTALCVVVVMCAATLSLLYRAERRYWLIEPDAALVVLLVLISLGLIYMTRG